MTLANPEFLILLLLAPILVFWYVKRNRKRTATIRYSNVSLVKAVERISKKRKFRHISFALRMLALTLLIVAFARPQSSHTEEEIITEGIGFSMSSNSVLHAADGNTRNVMANAAPIKDEFGENIGSVIAIHDITELKQADEMRIRLGTVVDQADDVILIAKISGIVEYVNPSFERITGLVV